MDNQISTRIENITPALATQLLSKNTSNRPLDEKRAILIANAIRRGEWQLNGDAIRLSRSGVLLDGQHRLRAIELSGQSAMSLFVSGLPDESFKTIDTNARSRTSSDVLALAGDKNTRVLAAAATFFYHWKRSSGARIQSTPTHQAPTPIQIAEVVKDTPRLNFWTTQAKNNSKLVAPSVLAFSFCVFEQHDYDKANAFFKQLSTGADLSPNAPALRLRNYLMGIKSSRSLEHRYVVVAYMFKAFKLFCMGAETKVLRVTIGGERAEKNLYTLD